MSPNSITLLRNKPTGGDVDEVEEPSKEFTTPGSLSPQPAAHEQEAAPLLPASGDGPSASQHRHPSDAAAGAVDVTASTMATTDDARDEEEEDSFDAARSIDETFTYSDDSASLSDAYFFPQSDDEFLARPPRYRNEISIDPMAPLHQYPLASYYGSMSNNNNNDNVASNGGANPERGGASPLWAASIQEDSEEKIAPNNNHVPHQPMLLDDGANYSHSTEHTDHRRMGRRERRRERRKKREQHIQQLQQAARSSSSSRERAVSAIRGRPQNPPHAQDVLWAVLFLVQLGVVLLCSIRFGYMLWFAKLPRHLGGTIQYNVSTNELQYNDDDLDSSYLSDTAEAVAAAAAAAPTHFKFTIDYQNVIALVSITGFYSCILTYLSFGFMLVLARALIQTILIFSVVLALAWGVIGLTLDPYGVISIMGFMALLLTLGYTMYNWSHVPFAAQNLYTAMCALRCSADVTILGLGCLVVAFAWCVIWGMAFVGIVNSLNNDECERKDVCGPHVENRHIPVYMLLLFSFHWTNSVIKNITRVTVASVVGTWWFYPGDIGSICTPIVGRPLLRSVTTSLGSICLGSLVVQPAQVLVAVLKGCCCVVGNPESNCMNPHGARVVPQAHNGSNILIAAASGAADEIESPADSVGLFRRLCGLNDRLSVCLRSCNGWSYTYIGMYGYGFAEAGERAIQLFETREWMDVVNDALIQNVLLMASLIIGGSTGTFAVVVEETDGFDFSSFHKPIFSAFLIGSVLGYVLSNILLLGVVGSAVNTILVCFAAGPFEFDKNHARLSREMREVWSQQVWEPQGFV